MKQVYTKEELEYCLNWSCEASSSNVNYVTTWDLDYYDRISPNKPIITKIPEFDTTIGTKRLYRLIR